MSSKAASSSPALLSPRWIWNQARRGEPVKEGWHTQRPRNSSAPCTFKTQIEFQQNGEENFLFLSCAQTSDTHVCVRIVQLHHNVGRSGQRDFGVTKNLHLVEDKRLVPGGIECVAHCHSFLGLMEEGHNGVGVWRHRGTIMDLKLRVLRYRGGG